ncbi:MAG TPA: hypothetical protein DIV41_04935, partial [Ruminococcaceae bacterium]|nr:hypothetical protein [Oscillospiraceae bacterium]
LIVADLNRRIADRQLTVQLTEEAKRFVVDEGYDPVYGARPLKRFIQSSVETMIAKKIISENIKPDSTVIIDSDGSRLTEKTA